LNRKRGAAVGDPWRLVVAIRPLAGSARLRAAGPPTHGAGKEHTMMRSIAALFSVFALGACVHEKVLEPAAGAELAPGNNHDVAEASAAGVTIKVSGDSWKGDPQDLGTLFTPVRVTLENHSGKTLRVSYRDFSLAGGSGFNYAAIPPMKAKGTLSARETPSTPRLQMAGWEHRRFFVAPHYSYLYPGVAPWSGPFAYDPFYYDNFYARWPEKLPTQDMLSEALPEGVVQDGGSVSGFVYFQSVTKRESAVQFDMNLVDASDGQTFGVVAIPFQTKQG
jgi:hypothetical protein